MKKYICVTYNRTTQRLLGNWARSHGFNLNVKYGGEPSSNPFVFHTTLVYSQEDSTLENASYDMPSKVIRPLSFARLGPDENIPVILVDPTFLLPIRNAYTTRYNLSDKWPEYKPHISLSYGGIPQGFDKLALPDFILVADKITVEDVEE